jgi:hypothetical protein
MLWSFGSDAVGSGFTGGYKLLEKSSSTPSVCGFQS